MNIESKQDVEGVYEMVKTFTEIAETGRASIECKVSFFYDVLHTMEWLMADDLCPQCMRRTDMPDATRQSHARLSAYLHDLELRLRAQVEWHEKNYLWPTCASVYRNEVPASVQEMHDKECPSTSDILTAERLSDIIRVAVAALESTQ